MVEQAKRLARRLHARQTDEARCPHTERLPAAAAAVAAVGGTEFEVALGCFHDAKEDTEVSDEDLVQIAGAEGLAILTALTHGKDEEHSVYLARVMQHPRAARVKLADLGHNTDPAHLAQLPPEKRERLEKKYAAAKAQLKA
jgi:(p)ppGpp synthase/HD superfamily hydrolase